MEAAILTALVAAAVIIPNWLAYRRDRDGEWHHHSDSQMRRMTHNGWEYRAMTHDEKADRAFQDAW